MDYKDIEKELKKKADQITLKSFDDRIKNRISDPEEVNVSIEEPVLVSGTGSETVKSGKRINKKLIIEILVPVFVLLALCAIILPQMLRKKDDSIRYFNLEELSYVGVTEEEFCLAINNTNMNIIDFSLYEISGCRLFVSSDNVVLGGKVDILDEVDFFMASVKFYSNVVITDFKIETENEVYNVNGFDVKYVTEFEDETYITVAIATNAEMRYEMEITSFDDDVTAKFDKLFAN